MPDFVLGLDLGQAADPTALVMLRRSMLIRDGKPFRGNTGGILSTCVVMHLHRYPLGTSYPAIVASVCELLVNPRLRPFKPRLAIDATGVGRAVMDMFIPALRDVQPDGLPVLPQEDLYPITITAGDKWSAHSYAPGVRGFHVPKLELASAVQAAIGSNRLEFARGLDPYLFATAVGELKTFKVKRTAAGNTTVQSARESDHDDIVLAIACAVWLGSLPRMTHRSETAFIETEDRAAASGTSINEAMKELRETADPETRSLIDEHAAETQSLKAEAEAEARRLDREHRDPNNPIWWT